MNILFITSNAHKVEEGQEKLDSLVGDDGSPPKLVQCPIEYPEVQADTLEEVALYGLAWLRERPELFTNAGFEPDSPFILEDSGLFVDALGGFPGVYSAYVFRTMGFESVLRLLAGREDADAREAVFVSAIGLSLPGAEPEVIRGECRGRIALTPEGEEGFGFDPVFIPAGAEATFASMDRAGKGECSHRGGSFTGLHLSLSKRP